ncbi:MAG TPA: biotin/lipoate--protein ligase family protein [Rhizobiaceae bacterium]|nr:biotin/lipoate--protein ligase family protein [Rhizobiaceae bacterium]
MSEHAAVLDRDPDLPPPYSLVTLREAGNAFAHACAIADDRGAGTLVWVRRYDLIEFAVVMEPETPLAEARLAIYAGMDALADALATHAPPSRPISFDWPDTIRVDDVLVGGGRLGWPEGTHDGDVPDWLVFSAMIRAAVLRGPEAGLRPLQGALDELGFEEIDPGGIIASFSRHLMTRFDAWNEDGFAQIGRRWLERLPKRVDEHVRIAENGDLLISRKAGSAERRSLLEILGSPGWLDPATGTPWL